MLRRMRKRYLALEVASEQHLSESDVMDAVWNSILKLFGEYIASQANLNLVEYIPQKNLVLVRCSHKVLERVRASIASIADINGKLAAIHVTGISGSLRALRRKV